MLPDLPFFKNFQCKSNTDGAPADYIPQLASFGPQHWGAAICTIDGQRYSIGDANVPFTMQSACQAITYAICLNELGADRVHSFQGKEPSGRAGDDIVLDHQSTKLFFHSVKIVEFYSHNFWQKFREINFFNK